MENTQPLLYEEKAKVPAGGINTVMVEQNLVSELRDHRSCSSEWKEQSSDA